MRFNLICNLVRKMHSTLPNIISHFQYLIENSTPCFIELKLNAYIVYIEYCYNWLAILEANEKNLMGNNYYKR